MIVKLTNWKFSQLLGNLGQVWSTNDSKINFLSSFSEESPHIIRDTLTSSSKSSIDVEKKENTIVAHLNLKKNEKYLEKQVNDTINKRSYCDR